MTKKDLQEYYWIKGNIRKLEDKLLELETRATKTNTTLSNMPKMLAVHYGLADIVIEIVEMRKLINTQLTKSYAKISEIENAINGLPEKEKYLIRSRYIECKSWEQIAVDMNYSWMQTHRIHSGALKMIACKDVTK